MAKLIALLSSGKGSWAQVNSLLSAESWDHAYLICNDYGYEKFEVKDPQKITKLKFDEKKLFDSMNKISGFLKKNVNDIDVALNLSSGSGMEHMLLMSAVLKAGLGIQFVYAEQDELKTIEILERPEGFEKDE